MKDIYVVNCCRTAIGSFGGSLKDTPAADLGAVVIKEALSRAGVKPEQVDEVMFGCILTAGLGQNVARQAAIKAGVPTSVPAYTVGMVCGCLLYTSNLEVIWKMANAYFTIDRPANDPFKGYLPGSKERDALKAELKRQSEQVVKIPLIIGGQEIYTDKTIKVTMPHDHGHVIAECCMAGEKELKMAVDSALAAKEEWESMPWEHRSAIFLKAADHITNSYRPVLNAATMLGQSKTVFQACLLYTSRPPTWSSATSPCSRPCSARPTPAPSSTPCGSWDCPPAWPALPFPPSPLRRPATSSTACSRNSACCEPGFQLAGRSPTGMEHIG